MAEIVSNYDGPNQLRTKFKILDKVRGGIVGHGSGFLNAALGVVRAHISFWIGNQEILGYEAYLHQMSVTDWVEQVRALITGELERDEIAWGIESPELLMNLRRFGEGEEAHYELTVALDVSALADEGVTGEGPGFLLLPKAESILQFSEDLLAEIAACLG